MKSKDDEKTQAEDDEQNQSPPDEEANGADDAGSEETKRFERSDNLRRRSEWFQKRTGGR